MCATSIIEEHYKRVTFSVPQGNRHADRQRRVQSLSEDSEAHTASHIQLSDSSCVGRRRQMTVASVTERCFRQGVEFGVTFIAFG